MSDLIRGISENGGVVFCGVDSTEIVRTAEQLHHTSATCSAALGRLLTGASLMGCVWRAAAPPARLLPVPMAPAMSRAALTTRW